MDIGIFIAILLSSLLVFAIPTKFKYYFSLIILCIAIVITSIWSVIALKDATNPLEINSSLTFLPLRLILIIDKLSAFFILVINFTVLTGFVFAKGYLKPYAASKSALQFSLHYFSYLWLYFSMVLVTIMRDGFSFLVVWEFMSLSSFLLVVFDAEDRNTMKIGINYLIQMHIGMIFILVAFLIGSNSAGEIGFSTLKEYFLSNPNLPLFLLFFIGFGIKAGFIPLHTWLPQAHPAAPSHVSGVMSGVMIKMGIYGILRVLTYVQYDLVWIGIFILAISLISGILGVMLAIVQHDLKRLLAYHSIENIGIIGIGIGLGMIGIATRNEALAILGLSGGLLHVLNHSLFKSLLFYSAGSVYSATHTRHIEHLGGLIKAMPYTAALFLIGSLAICGLPPFNGFISEYLIYAGMFKTVSGLNLYLSMLILISIIGLSLIGGLAIFCFTKAFGIVFLGQARSSKALNIKEVSKTMLLPQLFIVLIITAIGFASSLFVKPVFQVVSQSFTFHVSGVPESSTLINMNQISLLTGVFIVITVALLIYRKFHLQAKPVSYGATWGCGYTAGNERQQYTATSYADNYSSLASPILGMHQKMKEIEADDIFPKVRSFESHNYDIFKKFLIDKPVNNMLELLKRIAVMQTGYIQHYILYAFLFMLLVFLLTIFNLI